MESYLHYYSVMMALHQQFAAAPLRVDTTKRTKVSAGRTTFKETSAAVLKPVATRGTAANRT